MNSQPPLSSRRFEAGDAFEAIEMCFERGWTDGLPAVPPTEDRVRAFISYAERSPDDILGQVPVRNRVITVEKAAVNAVMAGCLPQYMPVVIAAVEAICEEPYNLHGSSASTGGSATLLIINGPIVKELGINSGANLFGPGCRANATIGRAIRLILMNVCGAIPGVLDRSTMGHPGKYTYCIAESEDTSPWEPYHVEQGFAAGTSAVTALAALAPYQIADRSSDNAESVLESIAGAIVRVGDYEIGGRTGSRYCVIVVATEHLNLLARAGLSKTQVKELLYQKSLRTVAEIKRMGMLRGAVAGDDNQKVLPAVSEAEKLVIIAGGGGGAFSACIAPWLGGGRSGPVTKAINVAGAR